MTVIKVSQNYNPS